MRYTTSKWISNIAIIEVDPKIFDSPELAELLQRARLRFPLPVSIITPDWEAEFGIRSAGDYCPPEILSSAQLLWHELDLLAESDELPF